MFGLIHRQKNLPYTTDVHSHLIPGIDDGVKSWEESLSILAELKELGIKKAITTPHIISDYYPNSPELIREKVEVLNAKIKEQNMDLSVEAGAEYFVDDWFVKQVESGAELLSFGGKYILVETGFINKPMYLEEVFFKLKARGLEPILAHPERYDYVQEDIRILERFRDMGVRLQVNASSFTGHYSPLAKKTAEAMVKKGWVDMIGSDVHHMRHVELLKKASKTKYFKKLGQLPLLNQTL
ncbi:tyrosine-protein phosphatase [Reichenbachiella ulvae]|uniref:protein-tyrosine-phosphatase n=1 Tax=Reichenbachiella ulvae TaxID=2980104 RepID=A0ABT3CYH4_9BACT|nr:CpsB/CapC family capsule biosynthesis tyrosine phosphatase [Reichenbachiella ulvae]MCV9388621.1 capsular biosynthesis protein [Reichenbachiella ulvae]